MRRTEEYEMKRTLQARIAAGAAILDHVRPDWFNEIDPAVLDIEHEQTCTLACLYGTYVRGADAVFGRVWGADRKAADAGFLAYTAIGDAANLDDSAVIDEYAILTRKWRIEIESRRAAQAMPLLRAA